MTPLRWHVGCLGRLITTWRAPPSPTHAPAPGIDRTSRGGFASVTGVSLALVLLMQFLISAQDVTEPALKAAYIYNFALFTEWPAGAVPTGGPFVMCVLGDDAVGDELERAVKGRTLAGRRMTVSHTKPGSQQMCHVLYVSGMTGAQAAQLVTGLRDAPVLTIGDIEGFTEIGGIAQFFFVNGKLRFTVQIESAKRARLQISSRLLALVKPR
jgi:hypothetical protein